MELLRWWLLLVAALRFFSVYAGYFNPWALRVAVFSKADVTDVHARTFAVWTAVTCTLCVLCSADLRSRGLYAATLASFAIALVYFLAEYVIYETVAPANLASPCIVAGVSIVWMLASWRRYAGPPAGDGKSAKAA